MQDKLKIYQQTAEVISCEFPFKHREDLIQEAWLVYPNVIKNYDESRGFQFSTYAANSIRNKMISFLYKENYETTLDDSLGDDNDTTKKDMISDPHNFETQYDDREALELHLKGLGQLEREIIHDYFYEGLKKKEILNKYNLSQVKLDMIIKPQTIAKKGQSKVNYGAEQGKVKNENNTSIYTLESYLEKHQDIVELLNEEMPITIIAKQTGRSRNHIYNVKYAVDNGKLKSQMKN